MGTEGKSAWSVSFRWLRSSSRRWRRLEVSRVFVFHKDWLIGMCPFISAMLLTIWEGVAKGCFFVTTTASM
jgi:hypothetical protein